MDHEMDDTEDNDTISQSSLLKKKVVPTTNIQIVVPGEVITTETGYMRYSISLQFYCFFSFGLFNFDWIFVSLLEMMR
jgi:hypothetical protein